MRYSSTGSLPLILRRVVGRCGAIFSAVCAVVALLPGTPVSAQPSTAVDSVTLRYDFKPGDHVTYRVISFDSVMIFSRTKRQIVRERVETVMFRCDSLVADGYAMTVVTTGYAATEYIDTLPAVTRNEHPWVGREIPFVMTPSGRRLRRLPAADSLIAGVAPGAPFQPLLLPDLGGEATFVGASGTFQAKQLMVDNVYPPVELTGTSFRVIPTRVDTAGHKALRVVLNDVGKVEYLLVAPGDGKIVTTTGINGAGEFYYDTNLGSIFAGQYMLIGDFQMRTSDGGEAEGRHVLSMMYEIAEEEG